MSQIKPPESHIVSFASKRLVPSYQVEEKFNQIESQKEPQTLIQNIHPLELRMLIQALPEEDAGFILTHASAEQINQILALDFDRPDYTTQFVTLEKFLSHLKNQGQGKVTEFFLKLDEELQTLYLAKRLGIYETRDETEKVPEEQAQYLTPDGTFIVCNKGYPNDQTNQSMPEQQGFDPLILIADLYLTDWRQADLMLRDAKWTIVTELEDELNRLSLGRIEALGIPSDEEALKIFARTPSIDFILKNKRHSQDPHASHTHQDPPLLQHYLEAYTAECFFFRALSLVQSHTLFNDLRSELIHLTYAFSLVHKQDVSNADVLQQAATEVKNLLSLGLEIQSEGSLEQASLLLSQYPLSVFLKVALFQTRQFQGWVKKAQKEGLFHINGHYLLESEKKAFIQSLLHPICPRLSTQEGEEKHAFSARYQIVQVQKKLEHWALQCLSIRILIQQLCPSAEKALQAHIEQPLEEVEAEHLLTTLLGMYLITQIPLLSDHHNLPEKPFGYIGIDTQTLQALALALKQRPQDIQIHIHNQDKLSLLLNEQLKDLQARIKNMHFNEHSKPEYLNLLSHSKHLKLATNHTPTATFNAQLPYTLKEIQSLLPIPPSIVVQSGKVRDNLVLNQSHTRIMITTDRISAFDHILGTIPFKGELLCQLAYFWFEKTKHIVPNHVIQLIDPQALLVHQAKVIPIEVIVRRYLTGSLWRSYQASIKNVEQDYGIYLPPGLLAYHRFESPLITPTSKASIGQHDTPLTETAIIESTYCTKDIWEQIKTMSLALFKNAEIHALKQGLILVDSKYEFGYIRTQQGIPQLVLVDEIHTPDSSRYWDVYDFAHAMQQKHDPESLDKEFLRRWLITQGFSFKGTPPALTDDIRVALAQRYWQLYERITGQPYPLQTGDTSVRLTKAIAPYLK